MHLLGNAILQNTFPHDSNVSFACDVGYTSAEESETITCTFGSWSTLRLRCESKFYYLIIYFNFVLNNNNFVHLPF